MTLDHHSQEESRLQQSHAKEFHKTDKQQENIGNQEKEQLNCENGIGRHQEISNLMRACKTMVAELQRGCERRSGDGGAVEWTVEAARGWSDGPVGVVVSDGLEIFYG